MTVTGLPEKIRQISKRNSANNELIKDSLFASVIRGLAAISSFVLNIVIGRNLGAQESGYFFLALTMITVLSSVARLGSDNVILRFLSVHSNKNEWNEVQSVFKYTITRVLICSGLIGIIVMIFSNQIAGKDRKSVV